MKITLFKLGLGLMIAGMIWISFIFSESEKTFDTTLLKQSTSLELKTKLEGEGIGFYKIHMPKFVGEEVFVQILDTKENIIQEQSVQTRMSVGYFDFNENGFYTIKVTNIAKNQIEIQVEFGDTNSQKMIPAGVLILGGAVAMIAISYLKLKNHSIAQPDENIS